MLKKTYRICLEGSDKKSYTASFDFVRQKLGICALDKRVAHRFNVIWDRLNELEEEMEALLIPKLESLILAFVKENPDVQTRQFTYKLWRKLKSRAERGAYYKAFKNLEGSGKIIATSHGPSLNRTWRATNE